MAALQRSGQSCQNISGATAFTYTPALVDESSTLVFVVSASNVDGVLTKASKPTSVVASAPPVNSKAPAVSGAAVVGVTLSANAGTWHGAGNTYTYQWQDCDATGQNCQPASGATSTSYTLTQADEGYTVRLLVTATNVDATVSAQSAATAVVGTTTNAPWFAPYVDMQHADTSPVAFDTAAGNPAGSVILTFIMSQHREGRLHASLGQR